MATVATNAFASFQTPNREGFGYIALSIRDGFVPM